MYLSTNKGRDWAAQGYGQEGQPEVSPEPTALIDNHCPGASTCLYRLVAFSAAGASPRSGTVTAANHIPSPPKDLSAPRAPSGVLLEWATPSSLHGLPVDYYEVYLSTNKGRDWAAQGYGQEGQPEVSPEPTALIDNHCGADQICMYHLYTVTAAGTSGASGSVTVKSVH